MKKSKYLREDVGDSELFEWKRDFFTIFNNLRIVNIDSFKIGSENFEILRHDNFSVANII